MLPFSIADTDGLFDFLRLYNIVKTKEDMPSRKTISNLALLDVCSSFEDPDPVRNNTTKDSSSSLNYRNQLLDFLEPTDDQSGDMQEPAQPVRRTLRDEANEYFDEARMTGRSSGVLKWWGKHDQKFPVLAKLARLVLAIPATSAASESAFSISSCVISARRSNIAPYNASQILFVHDNYDLVQKYLPSLPPMI